MSQGVCNPVEFNFICPLPNGLHARPASQLAEFASAFASELCLTNLRSGAEANLKSTLAIISADVRKGDPCAVRVSGPDEKSAGEALREYVDRHLPRSDEPLLEISTRRNVLPRALSLSAVTCFYGVPVSPGIAKGRAVIAGGVAMPESLEDDNADDPKREERKIERALANVRERLRNMLARSMSTAETGVLKAHLAIVNDVSFSDRI